MKLSEMSLKMKNFKINFDHIEGFIRESQLLEAAIDEIVSKIATSTNEITESNNGKLIVKFAEISDEQIQELNKLKATIENLQQVILNYTSEFRSIDLEKRPYNRYELDLNTKPYLETLSNYIQNINYQQHDNKLENEIDEYQRKVREFRYVDSSINVEIDYPNNEDMKYYIRQKQNEIEEQIAAFQYNYAVYEEVEFAIRSIVINLESDINYRLICAISTFERLTNLELNFDFSMPKSFSTHPTTNFTENDFNFEDFSNLIASLSINYDAKRFKLTSDVYGVEKAIKKLLELGYSEDQALTIFSIVNMQHIEKNTFEEYYEYIKNQLEGEKGMVEKGTYTKEQSEYILSWYQKNYDFNEKLYNKVVQYKNLDLSHMMIAISAQLDNKPKGLLLEIGLNGYRDEYFSWKGDVESGNMDEDDIRANINAFVIANMYKENGHFNQDDAMQYISDVQTGKINPVDEFLKIYGDGDIIAGYEEVVNELNDTTSGTVVINAGMPEGVLTEVIDIIPWDYLKYENYFADNIEVQNAYAGFIYYLKNNSSIKISDYEKEIYQNDQES